MLKKQAIKIISLTTQKYIYNEIRLVSICHNLEISGTHICMNCDVNVFFQYKVFVWRQQLSKKWSRRSILLYCHINYFIVHVVFISICTRTFETTQRLIFLHMYPNKTTCFTNTYTFLIFELGPYTLSIPIHRRHQL